MENKLTKEKILKLHEFFTVNNEDALDYDDAIDSVPVALEMLMDLLGIDY